MKIVTFWGGLGNQIFDYAYYQWLKSKFPNESIYAYFPRAGLSGHNGLEIFKRFNVEKINSCFYVKIIAAFLFYIVKILKILHLPLIGTCTMKNKKYDAIFHCDWWQDHTYYPDNYRLEYKKINLNLQNQRLVEKINFANSISIHIRRGDYLDPIMKNIYGGICTNAYYEKAIAVINKNVDDNKLFIFFSDDPEYVREHYKLPNMIVVDWNKGEDSFLDMCLMSKCQYMILANSTFSYWAAMFNNVKKIVICPKRWNNLNNPNITPSTWITIES